VYIGIDCGTQGLKVAIWDGINRLLGVGYEGYSLLSNDKGKKEQHVEWWLDAIVIAMDRAFADANGSGNPVQRKQIRAIGVSGQQHGLVVLDENDQVIRPAKLWCDTEPTDLLNRFVDENHLDFAKTIGINVPVAFTIAKLIWTKSAKPEDFERISKIMLPHDYINYWFTGNYVTEAGDASGSGLLDTHSKQWCKEIIELIELPDKCQLPTLITSEQAHGTIRKSLASELGLSDNVLISSGGGDNMMAAIGTGNVGSGLLTMSLGTSGTVYSHTKQQVNSALYPDLNAFCSSTNGYLPLASTMNVTSATTAFRELLKADIPTFESAIASVDAGSNGLCVMPYLVGARLPNVPKAKGAMFGLTADNLSQAHMLRAAVEGVTYNLAKGVEVLSAAGLSFDSVSLIGGGSNSETWRQMIADVTGLIVNVPTTSEAGALGAAMQAKWAYCTENGIASSIEDIAREGVALNSKLTARPIQSNHDRYKALYQAYHQQVDQYVAQFI
jgi:xylulokinase